MKMNSAKLKGIESNDILWEMHSFAYYLFPRAAICAGILVLAIW